MIDHEVDHMVEEQKNQMKYQGIELDQYLGYIGQTLDQFKTELRETASNRVRTHLVLHTIAEAEKVEAGESEIEAEIGRMATQYGMKLEDLKERLAQSGSGFVQENVVHRKTIDLLTSSAIPVASQPVIDLGQNPTASPPAGKEASSATPAAKKRSRKKDSQPAAQPDGESPEPVENSKEIQENK